MQNKQEIAQEVSQLNVLHTVTQAYGQLASILMNNTRENVLRSRDFVMELNDVFLRVFSAYAQELQRIAKKKKLDRKGNITFLAHNGKKVAVLLSANMGFYGDIVRNTFRLFVDEFKSGEYEATIVGRQGLQIFQSEYPNHPYTYFDFSDEKLDEGQLRQMMRHLVQYEEIRVYYGRFQNFLTQKPVVFTLSANPYENLSQSTQQKRYLFEPDIEHILMFFEKQIFTSVFEQTIRESQLSKFASRVMVMDRASENIKDRLKFMSKEQQKIIHREMNRKQLAQFASMALWN